MALFGLSDELLGAIIGGVFALVAAILAAVLTGRATSRKVKEDLDLDLRNRKVEPYEDLWVRLAPLAFHSHASNAIATSDLESLRGTLRDWYYEEGRGLHLSKESRNAYLALQAELQRLIRASAPMPGDDEMDRLKNVASALRTSMKGDLGISS